MNTEFICIPCSSKYYHIIYTSNRHYSIHVNKKSSTGFKTSLSWPFVWQIDWQGSSYLEKFSDSVDPVFKPYNLSCDMFEIRCDFIRFSLQNILFPLATEGWQKTRTDMFGKLFITLCLWRKSKVSWGFIDSESLLPRTCSSSQRFSASISLSWPCFNACFKVL